MSNSIVALAKPWGRGRLVPQPHHSKYREHYCYARHAIAARPVAVYWGNAGKGNSNGTCRRASNSERRVRATEVKVNEVLCVLYVLCVKRNQPHGISCRRRQPQVARASQQQHLSIGREGCKGCVLVPQN